MVTRLVGMSGAGKSTIGREVYSHLDNIEKNKIALYTVLAFSGMRKVMVTAPNFTSVVAYLYSKMVRIIHIPRLIKLNLFPGLGKQNYT
mgnify:CR=1 FL=1